MSGMPLWVILVISILTALVLAPLLFFVGAISGNSWVTLGFGLLGTLVFTIAILIITGIVVYLIWRILPRWIQVMLVVFLFVIGLLTFNPELDIVAVLGAIFTFLGVGARNRNYR